MSSIYYCLKNLIKLFSNEFLLDFPINSHRKSVTEKESDCHIVKKKKKDNMSLIELHSHIHSSEVAGIMGNTISHAACQQSLLSILQPSTAMFGATFLCLLMSPWCELSLPLQLRSVCFHSLFHFVKHVFRHHFFLNEPKLHYVALLTAHVFRHHTRLPSAYVFPFIHLHF